MLTAAAAVGWLLDRVGLTTPLATTADTLGPASPWLVVVLWAVAVVAVVRAESIPGHPRPASHRAGALADAPA